MVVMAAGPLPTVGEVSSPRTLVIADHSGKGAPKRFGIWAGGCAQRPRCVEAGGDISKAELGTLEAIGVILLFVIALGVLNRIEFGSFD